MFYLIECEAGDVNRLIRDPDGELQFDVIGDNGENCFIVHSPIGSANELVEHIRRVKLYPNFLMASEASEDWLMEQGLI